MDAGSGAAVAVRFLFQLPFYLWFHMLAGIARFLVSRTNRALGGKFRACVRGLRWNHAELGQLGEDLAAKWLRQNGRRVLYRNFRAPHGGEVDIVCRHRDALVFVEVKTRTGDGRGRPADAVNPDKQRLIQRGAGEWLRLLGNPSVKFRFDIVEVMLIDGEKPRLSVIENAFQMPPSSVAGR